MSMSFRSCLSGVVAALLAASVVGAEDEGPVVRVPGPFGTESVCFLADGHQVTGSDAGFPAGASSGSLSLWFNCPAGVGDKVLLSYGSPPVPLVRRLVLASPGTDIL